MPFTICTPSEADAPEVSTIHLNAMDQNLLTHAQFPSPEGLQFFHGWLAQNTIEHIHDADKRVLIARDDETGEIASFIKWYIRSAKDAKEVAGATSPPADEWPDVARPEYLDPYAALTDKVRDRVMGNVPYYHPSYICTNPRWVGRGAASQLMRKVQELAADDHLPIALEATMNAVTFYQKLGFEIKDELSMILPARGSIEPTELYEEKCMVWTPPKQIS